MVKKVKVTLLIVLSVLSQAAYSAAWDCPALRAQGFNNYQMAVAYNAFHEGKKKDMAYSLAAIAWKESSAGKFLRNPADPSAGVFHVTLDNALSYIKWQDTEENRKRVETLLIEDFTLSAEFAMINLQFWKDQYGQNWMLIWRRYNGGYTDSEASKIYARDIARKVRVISKCNW